MTNLCVDLCGTYRQPWSIPGPLSNEPSVAKVDKSSSVVVARVSTRKVTEETADNQEDVANVTKEIVETEVLWAEKICEPKRERNGAKTCRDPWKSWD